MKTLSQFLTEANYDPEIQGRSQIRQTGEGGRKQPKKDTADRRKPGQKQRMKAVGGGKMAPVGSYKDRKDIGSTKARSEREQQPTQERGSAALSAREQQRKAYLERKARERGGARTPITAKSKEKAASELLKKKTTKAVSPNYKPAKASGKTRAERDKIRGEGERYLKSVFKDQETAKYKKETGQNPDAKGRTKILGRVNKRMST